jgi:hypothetical protein
MTAGIRLLLLEASSPLDNSTGEESDSQKDDGKPADDTTDYCPCIGRLLRRT